MSTKNTGFAFFIGALVGGAAAVLWAPARGSQTRQRLRENAENAYEKGSEAVSDVADAAREKSGNVADSAKQRVDAVKTAVEEGNEAFHRELEKEAEN